MELWLLACVMLVFLSLLEYSIILWDGVKKRNAANLRLQVTKREKVSFWLEETNPLYTQCLVLGRVPSNTIGLRSSVNCLMLKLLLSNPCLISRTLFISFEQNYPRVILTFIC